MGEDHSTKEKHSLIYLRAESSSSSTMTAGRSFTSQKRMLQSLCEVRKGKDDIHEGPRQHYEITTNLSAQRPSSGQSVHGLRRFNLTKRK